MGIVDRPIRRLPSHPHPPKFKEIPKVLPQVAGVPVHLPPFRTSHSLPGLYNDCKGSEANGPLQRTQTSPIPGQLADRVPVSEGSPSEHSGIGRPNPVLGVDNKSGKIRTKTYSGVFVRGLRISSRFSPCKTHSTEMAQTSGFDPTSQVKTCFDCKMFDVTNWVACLIVVIALGWPGMSWFWDLVQLSTEIPLQLPVSTTLLKQSHNYVFHSSPQHLNLHTWCLVVDSSKNKASLWRWQSELLPLRGHQQGPFTGQSGPYLRNGAEKIQCIFPIHL